MKIQIANELAGDGRVRGVSVWPGGEYLTGPRNMFLHSKTGFQERVDEIVQYITDPSKPGNLILAYFDQPDGMGHRKGPHDPETVAIVKRMDELTGYFPDKLKGLGIENEINLIFLNDHGMTGIRPEEVIDPRGATIKQYFQNGAKPVLQICPRHDP